MSVKGSQKKPYEKESVLVISSAKALKGRGISIRRLGQGRSCQDALPEGSLILRALLSSVFGGGIPIAESVKAVKEPLNPRSPKKLKGWEQKKTVLS